MKGLSQMVEDIREGHALPFRPENTDIMLILPADKARELGVAEIPLFPVLAGVLGWKLADAAETETE